MVLLSFSCALNELNVPGFGHEKACGEVYRHFVPRRSRRTTMRRRHGQVKGRMKHRVKNGCHSKEKRRVFPS